jgi:2-hydroxy-3-oxopropionate reductase
MGTNVGFIGLGVMGGAMAANIMKAGHPLVVHNRTRPKASQLLENGARWGETPADTAADIVLLSLPDTADVEKVLFGENGLAAAMKPDSIIVDSSSISATETIKFANRLAQSGVHMLDMPVSGGPKAAKSGTLSCMIGGEAEVLERVRPLLSAVGRDLIHIGPSGAGQLCKACNQLVIVSTVMGIAEAFALCENAGIDAQKVQQALMSGSARSFVLENHGSRLLQGTLEPGFRSTLMRKDIRLANRAMSDFEVFAPVAAFAEQMLTALINSGNGDKDSAALGLVTRELSHQLQKAK